MKEFIITEERLQDYENNLPEYITVNGCKCETRITMAEIHARPYSAAGESNREKAFVDLVTWLSHRPGKFEDLTLSPFQVLEKINEISRGYAELRQHQREPVKVCDECENDYTGTGYIKGTLTVCSGCNYRGDP